VSRTDWPKTAHSPRRSEKLDRRPLGIATPGGLTLLVWHTAQNCFPEWIARSRRAVQGLHPWVRRARARHPSARLLPSMLPFSKNLTDAQPPPKLAKLLIYWRKGWDSNPRYPCRHAGFQDRCLKPLGHPSVFGVQRLSRGVRSGKVSIAADMRCRSALSRQSRALRSPTVTPD
jgi:hypothetical protein